MDRSRNSLLEIALVFLKVGLTAFGAATIGVMQMEVQEKRGWLSRERYLEGLSLIYMLPGATATQLAIFLGYERAGWRGGLLAGTCFVVPAFFIMLALTLGYFAFGTTLLMKGALYGMGAVAMAVFAAAALRLAKPAAASLPQAAIALGAMLALAFTPLGIVPVLLLAAGGGITLFCSRRLGAAILAGLALALALLPSYRASVLWTSSAPELASVGIFFFQVGALSFGGGLMILAFIQNHVVGQFGWLTQTEFIDGLALGQLMPGPMIMVAAYVGYKLAGLAGAALAAGAIFLPSFILMLAVLPVFARVAGLAWAKAAIRGITPAVVGMLAITLARMAPEAVPDLAAVAIFAAALASMIKWQIGPLRLLGLGAVIGMLTLP